MDSFEFLKNEITALMVNYYEVKNGNTQQINQHQIREEIAEVDETASDVKGDYTLSPRNFQNTDKGVNVNEQNIIEERKEIEETENSHKYNEVFEEAINDNQENYNYDQEMNEDFENVEEYHEKKENYVNEEIEYNDDRDENVNNALQDENAEYLNEGRLS